ncbi:unnamed protein product [Paramecium octaurelia]|uniref:Uncharacterized protein n=1 Tax=Paramecium octaurelia TaxID=43137 RepID=A0A8S1TMJ3_PAROT|nr:unnamed protein product [Paramecium octaurelia]
MNDKSVPSNSNHLDIRINISKLLQSKFSSQSPIMCRSNQMFGDDEKNHRRVKPLIIYDDITQFQMSQHCNADRLKTTSSASSSSCQKRMTLKLTQSTESDNLIDNSTSFYSIISQYYDYYNSNQREKSENQQILEKKSVKKIERLQTEYDEQVQSQNVKSKSSAKYEKRGKQKNISNLSFKQKIM